MQFDQLVALFRARRRMYVADDRYHTMVAFIEGANCVAYPAQPLDGFDHWVGRRFVGGPSPVHWAAQIKRFHFGEVDRELGPEEEERLCVAALDLIQEFRQGLREQSPVRPL